MTDSQTFHERKLPRRVTSRWQHWSTDIKYSAIPRIFFAEEQQKRKSATAP
jgi:hypothetical protein